MRIEPETERAGRIPHIPELDALRGLAVTAVLALHCGVLRYGWVGVWLFFVLSGFVITLTLCNRGEPGKVGARLFWDFLARRAFRLWPVLYTYAVLAFIISLLATEVAQWGPLLAAIGFGTNIYQILGGADFSTAPIAHAWTLAVELHFYVLIGLLFLFAPRRWFVIVLIAMLAVAPAVRALVSYWASGHMAPDHASFAVYAFTLCHLDAFAIGALLAMFRDRVTQSARLVRGMIAWACAGALAYVAFCLFLNFEGGARGGDMFRHIISGVLFGGGREVFLYSAVNLAAAALIAAVLAGAPLLRWVVGSPLLQALGRISYGVYLYHLAVLTAALALLRPWLGALRPMQSEDLASNFVVFALVFPVSVGAAMLSHRFIEQPLVALGRTLERARWARRAAMEHGAQFSVEAAPAPRTISHPRES